MALSDADREFLAQRRSPETFNDDCEGRLLAIIDKLQADACGDPMVIASRLAKLDMNFEAKMDVLLRRVDELYEKADAGGEPPRNFGDGAGVVKWGEASLMLQRHDAAIRHLQESAEFGRGEIAALEKTVAEHRDAIRGLAESFTAHEQRLTICESGIAATINQLARAAKALTGELV